MSDAVPYDDLDPGIRELVRWLNDNGFETTDSGDGKSKFKVEDPPCCAVSFPNVAIRVDVENLIAETDRLFGLLKDKGCAPVPAKEEEVAGEVNLQSFYDPSLEGPREAYIILTGLDDEQFTRVAA